VRITAEENYYVASMGNISTFVIKKEITAQKEIIIRKQREYQAVSRKSPCISNPGYISKSEATIKT